MGLFGKKGKDDKLQEELEQARKEAEASKKALKDILDQNVQTKQGKAEAEKKALEAEKKIKDLEDQIKSMAAESNEKRVAESRQRALEERQARIEGLQKPKPKLIATHTVEQGETLSHVALKYYQHATPPYWKFLLEHNKEVLKGSEKNVRTGMKLEIPELPAELKD